MVDAIDTAGNGVAVVVPGPGERFVVQAVETPDLALVTADVPERVVRVARWRRRDEKSLSDPEPHSVAAHHSVAGPHSDSEPRCAVGPLYDVEIHRRDAEPVPDVRGVRLKRALETAVALQGFDLSIDGAPDPSDGAPDPSDGAPDPPAVDTDPPAVDPGPSNDDPDPFDSTAPISYDSFVLDPNGRGGLLIGDLEAHLPIHLRNPDGIERRVRRSTDEEYREHGDRYFYEHWGINGWQWSRHGIGSRSVDPPTLFQVYFPDQFDVWTPDAEQSFWTPEGTRSFETFVDTVNRPSRA